MPMAALVQIEGQQMRHNRIYILFAYMDDISFPVDAWNESTHIHDQDNIKERKKIAMEKYKAQELQVLCIDLPSHLPDSLFFPRIDASECKVVEVPLEF
jgi:hypothetical protein